RAGADVVLRAQTCARYCRRAGSPQRISRRRSRSSPGRDPALASKFHVKQHIEPEPTAAAELAGDRIDVLRSFTHDLGERGEPLGLIGPLEPARLWTRHVLNSAVLAPYIATGARVADIGTGGGMPGLV